MVEANSSQTSDRIGDTKHTGLEEHLDSDKETEVKGFKAWFLREKNNYYLVLGDDRNPADIMNIKIPLEKFEGKIQEGYVLTEIKAKKGA